MKEFINWCNTNQGFLTLILSIFTILISIIAIIVSIETSRLPYKKRLILGFSFSYIVNETGTLKVPNKIQLCCTNGGNRSIRVHTLALGYDKKDIKQIYCMDDGLIKPNTLKPSDIISFEYTFATVVDFLKHKLESQNSDITLNTQLYIFARDTEGKTYIKKFNTINDLLLLVNS